MKYKCIIFTEKDKSYIYVDDLETYYLNLELLFKHIENTDSQHLIFSYISMCSATLEASLNQIIFEFYINKFGPTLYKKYTDSIINTNFSNKLHLIPTIVTELKYTFDRECNTIKILEELITMRNRVLHKKPSLNETFFEIGKANIGDNVKIEYTNYLKTITFKKCRNYHDAIMNFKNDFLVPFYKNDFGNSKILKCI
ncbi:hypothetical protein ACTS95_12240 [Empedobacter brevis]